MLKSLLVPVPVARACRRAVPCFLLIAAVSACGNASPVASAPVAASGQNPASKQAPASGSGDVVFQARIPQLIVQIKDADGEWLESNVGNRTLRVYSVLPADDSRVLAFQKIYAENPEYRLLVDLIEAAKRFHRNSGKVPDGMDPVQWRRMLDDPLYVAVEGVLTDNPAQGLVIRTPAGDEVHRLSQYAGCAVTPEELVQPGFLDTLYHETGHLLARLATATWTVPTFERASTAASEQEIDHLLRRRGGQLHDIQQTTFGFGAMEEAMAEAWETIRILRRPVASAEAWKLDPSQSLDSARRYTLRPKRPELIIANRLVFEPATPSPEIQADIGPDAALLLYRRTMPLDNRRLRPCGPQMSTEGVIATLYVRLVTNPELRDATLPPALLAAAAPGGVAPGTWLADLGPDGRGMLRLVLVLLSIGEYHQGVSALNVGFRQVADTWLRVFPTDATVFIRTVVGTTHGATASLELSGKVRRFLAANDNPPYRSDGAKQATALGGEVMALADGIKDSDALFAACGPEIWVRLDGTQLYNEWGGCAPFQVDLNAAEEMDLRMFPGMTPEKAARLIAIRDEKGWFASLDEFFQFAEFDSAQRAAVQILPARE